MCQSETSQVRQSNFRSCCWSWKVYQSFAKMMQKMFQLVWQELKQEKQKNFNEKCSEIRRRNEGTQKNDKCTKQTEWSAADDSNSYYSLLLMLFRCLKRNEEVKGKEFRCFSILLNCWTAERSEDAEEKFQLQWVFLRAEIWWLIPEQRCVSIASKSSEDSRRASPPRRRRSSCAFRKTTRRVS